VLESMNRSTLSPLLLSSTPLHLTEKNCMRQIWLLAAVIATQLSASLAQTDRDARLKAAYPRLDAYIARGIRATGVAGLAGTFTSPSGVELKLVGGAETLFLHRGEQDISLERYGVDSFLIPLPEIPLFPLRFHRHHHLLAEVFYGADWYMGQH
jgi:hypothetical protein